MGLGKTKKREERCGVREMERQRKTPPGNLAAWDTRHAMPEVTVVRDVLDAGRERVGNLGDTTGTFTDGRALFSPQQ